MTTLKKGLLRLLLLLLLYFLQADVFPHLRILGVCPLPLPLAAIGIGLFEGGLAGGLWGLAAGLLCDLSLGGSCAFTILLTLVGFFTGFLAEFVIARGFPSFLVLSVSTLLLGVVIQLFPLLLNGAAPLSRLAVTGLIQLGYSLLFTLPVYCFARGISRVRAA